MDASVFWRFDELVATVRPVDAAGNLGDLTSGLEAGLGGGSGIIPPIVDGVTGAARSFGGAVAGHGMAAKDLVSGSTLHTRDVSIQGILTYDIALANAQPGNPCSIVARGHGATAANYYAYAIEIRIVNFALLIAEVRFIWQDTAGNVKTQIGGHFQASSAFMLLTATRRWISSTSVVLRYYIGDQLIAEVPSADGDIGGGTTATMTVGMRVVGGPTRWYCGKIDELRIVPRELQPEEIAATYNRITIEQPAGYELIKQLHDPGFPISADPDSRVQRETRMWGDALGYASAQADNFRENILPDRAYGDVLTQWEAITKKSPKVGDSVDQRRARVLSRFAQKSGVSIPGVKDALIDLAATNPDNLAFISFSPDTSDNYAAAGTGLNTLRWFYDVAARWTISGDALRVENTAAADIKFDGATKNWYSAVQSVGESPGAHIGVAAGGSLPNVAPGYRGLAMWAKLSPTSASGNTEWGVFFGDAAHNNYVLLGYRWTGATSQVITEFFVGGVSQGAVVRATIGALAPIWLLLQQNGFLASFGGSPPASPYDFAWATAASSGPYTSVPQIAGHYGNQWAGLYSRTLAGGAASDVKFDDVLVRQPNGDRAFRWFVYRDPALPGAPDLVGADLAIKELGHAYTLGHLIANKVAKYDDPATGYDITPMGSI